MCSPQGYHGLEKYGTQANERKIEADASEQKKIRNEMKFKIRLKYKADTSQIKSTHFACIIFCMGTFLFELFIQFDSYFRILFNLQLCMSNENI